MYPEYIQDMRDAERDAMDDYVPGDDLPTRAELREDEEADRLHRRFQERSAR